MKNEALISDIQHFSLGDGPGIRTTVFFKGCNLHCPWCHNPETILPNPNLLYFERLCSYCGNCSALCKLHKITETGHQFDRAQCVSCGKCAQACPTGALKLSGKKMTLEAIMENILQDDEFYCQSGGGVTLSGGEPLLQADFCAQLAHECQNNNIKIIIDTAGNVNYSQFEKVLPYTNGIYLDLKGDDALKMQKFTGANLKLILNNLNRLVRDKINVTVRIPIIPGYNDTPQSAVNLAQYIKKYGPATVNLLPFHRMGGQKYAAMGKNYAYAHFQPIPSEKLEELLQTYLAAGLETELII